jgi:chaperonin GroES
MKLYPLADNVLVKSTLEEETTSSGIILATATKEKSIVSEVVAVGPGTTENPMTVKVGDKVVVAKHAGQELLVHTGGYKLLFILHTGLRVGEALVEIYAHLDMTQNRFVQRSIEDLKDF